MKVTAALSVFGPRDRHSARSFGEIGLPPQGRASRARACRFADTLSVLGALALFACAGAQDTQSTQAGPLLEEPPPPPQPVHPSGSQEAAASVTRAGGTFSLTSGARLEIPEGAISEPVDVSFHVGAEGHAFGDRERQRPLGPLLAVEPALFATDGASFTVSVPALALPQGWTESDLAFAMEEVDDEQRAIDTLATQTRWNFYPVTVENGRFVARVTGLPGHRLQFGVAR